MLNLKRFFETSPLTESPQQMQDRYVREFETHMKEWCKKQSYLDAYEAISEAIRVLKEGA